MYVYKNMKGTNKIVMGKALAQAGLSNLINLKSSTTSFTSILSDVRSEQLDQEKQKRVILGQTQWAD